MQSKDCAGSGFNTDIDVGFVAIVVFMVILRKDETTEVFDRIE